MKNILFILIFFISGILISQTKNITSSEVRWKAYKTLKTDAFSHYGTIKLKSGNLIFRDGEISGGNFVIDMKAIDAEDMKDDKKMKLMLENHLRSDDFFDVSKYPFSTFKITSTKKINSGKFTHQITGDLRIKDITKKISFPVTVANNGAETTVTSAMFTFNRKSFGLKYNVFEDMIISNDVEITLKLTAK